jgi:methylase of polypeptide subunit release factors
MIKKTLLNELLKTQDLQSLEKHLLYSYINTNNLDYKKSPLLANYFIDFECAENVYLDIQNLQIKTIKLLENYLELIIPQSDRKLNGAFFTPDYIIEFIINEIKPENDSKNLDPSCGCGAFLIGLTEYYKNNFGKSIKQTIQENIFGADILDYNIHRAKLILTIFALQNDEILEESDFNLYHQDSLRVHWEQQFDNILGNPPYVKFQDLSDENRVFLIQNWKTIERGTFNLYFAFFELGYELLKPSGKLGYITPNNYFTSLSGESIRKYFQQKKCVSRILDFNHKKVFDVQTYTAITFLNKKENETILFDRIKDNYNPKDFLLIANGSPNYIKDLNSKKWRLLKSEEQKNIKTIETIGTPIGRLFDISVGIATLKDDIFFISTIEEKNNCYLKITENGIFEIEKEATKAVYKISDFKNQDEIENNKRRIIFPYKLKKGLATAIPELEFKVQFPKCYNYLLSEKERLVTRDKGKVKFDPFYIWGRTQGLTKIGKKILTPTFSQSPRFLVVKEEDAYFTNGYGLFFRQSFDIETIMNPITKIENIDIVQKILNSYLMQYYVDKTSVAIEGGYPCYQKNFIEKFTIPLFTENEIQILRSLDDKEKIDFFLFEKYQLNELAGNLVV